MDIINLIPVLPIVFVLVCGFLFVSVLRHLKCLFRGPSIELRGAILVEAELIDLEERVVKSSAGTGSSPGGFGGGGL